MKNLIKAVEFGRNKINPQRNLNLDDVEQLIGAGITDGKNGFYEALSSVYYAGFTQGYKQREAEETC